MIDENRQRSGLPAPEDPKPKVRQVSEPRSHFQSEGTQKVLFVEGLPLRLLPIGRGTPEGHGSPGGAKEAAAVPAQTDRESAGARSGPKSPTSHCGLPKKIEEFPETSDAVVREKQTSNAGQQSWTDSTGFEWFVVFFLLIRENSNIFLIIISNVKSVNSNCRNLVFSIELIVRYSSLLLSDFFLEFLNLKTAFHETFF